MANRSFKKGCARRIQVHTLNTGGKGINMDFSLPLDKMTSLDKIAIMEKLWDGLCRNPESISSPEWHKEILQAREMQGNEGKAKFSSFDQAKERIRNQIK